MEEIRESLNGRKLSLSRYFQEAETYKQMAREALEFTKVRRLFTRDLSASNSRIRNQTVSDRARDNEMRGKMARDSGRASEFPYST